MGMISWSESFVLMFSWCLSMGCCVHLVYFLLWQMFVCVCILIWPYRRWCANGVNNYSAHINCVGGLQILLGNMWYGKACLYNWRIFVHWWSWFLVMWNCGIFWSFIVISRHECIGRVINFMWLVDDELFDVGVHWKLK